MPGNRYYEKEKWSDSQISQIRTLIKGMIEDVEVKMSVVLPSGKFVMESGHSDSMSDEYIKEEWSGGVLVFDKIYKLTPVYDPDLVYYFELSMSAYVPYYGTINDCKRDVLCYYETFEELVDALERINKGKPPYKYNIKLAEHTDLPVEEAFDYYPNAENDSERITQRVSFFG